MNFPFTRNINCRLQIEKQCSEDLKNCKEKDDLFQNSMLYKNNFNYIIREFLNSLFLVDPHLFLSEPIATIKFGSVPTSISYAVAP